MLVTLWLLVGVVGVVHLILQVLVVEVQVD
jgi:hypothetical protein